MSKSSSFADGEENINSETKRCILMKRFADKLAQSAETSSGSRSITCGNAPKILCLYRCYQIGYRLQLHARKKMIEKIKIFGSSVRNVPTSLTEDLKQKSAILEPKILNTVMNSLNKIKTLFDKSRDDLSVSEQLERMLCWRIPDFAQFPELERKEICKIMRYESFEAGTVLLWEDHIVTSFYLVLSGQMEIFKLSASSKLRLVIWNSGTVLGHARIKVKNATRSAGAVFLSPAVLLTIDRGIFLYNYRCLPQDY
jgi:hypothetical protein